ncbi:serine hydrolase domain-containing protein [Clostridium diolis]|uniref:serine hydrolase domain-containing protein n=1 Tax=Clostridium diolis TaxID=223919 RepID=UPI003AF9C886
MNTKLLRPFIESAENLRITNIIIYQNGERIAEHHWDEEIRRNQYSASKSFTATAVGIAISEGMFSLEDKVLKYFEQDAPKNPSENLKNLTVRDLLTMSIGHDKGYLMGGERPFLSELNWVKYVLNQKIVYVPGETFVYNNAGPYLAGVLIQKLAKCDLVEYLMPRLFEPLGIIRPTWETDPQGLTFGAGGLTLTVSDMAKFGQLYLQEGTWNGKQLISKQWVYEATKKQMDTHWKKDVGEGYGYLFWRGRHDSFRADGKYGQYSIVLKDKNAVIAVNAECREQQKILDCIWDKVYDLL